MTSDAEYIRLGLRLARRAFGAASPNPLVGAVLVKGNRIIGRGWHHRAGEPHAEIEALRDAERRGQSPKSATLYATLEPCCTWGRTPPCTGAIIKAGIGRVIVGAIDPNPKHSGKGLAILRRAGITIKQGVLEDQCERLNEAFNHWIQHGLPFVTVKAAMTLDGKIATASGESKWITGQAARDFGMQLRQGADAIVVGINTVLADDPSLTFRQAKVVVGTTDPARLRRIVLDSRARTPLDARVVRDASAALTTIVVGPQAPESRKRALSKRVRVLVAPSSSSGRIPLPWLLKKLGSENVTSLLVEGGGEVNAAFLFAGLAQRVAFFYAPMVLGGADARKAVGGQGAASLKDSLALTNVKWRKLGTDWLLQAEVKRKD